MAINALSKCAVRVVTVIANKPVIPEGVYTEKHQLYHYLCRFLLERVSWLCRDLRPDVPEAVGPVKIVFSRRRSIKYDDFQAYVQRLKDTSDPDIRIHWPVIDMAAIEAQDRGSRFRLQLADLATSGITFALEPDFYGNVEPRYARMLKPTIYHRGHNYMSYGTKMFSPADQIELTDRQREFVAMFR